jgi:hypothetical protein
VNYVPIVVQIKFKMRHYQKLRGGPSARKID